MIRTSPLLQAPLYCPSDLPHFPLRFCTCTLPRTTALRIAHLLGDCSSTHQLFTLCFLTYTRSIRCVKRRPRHAVRIALAARGTQCTLHACLCIAAGVINTPVATHRSAGCIVSYALDAPRLGAKRNNYESQSQARDSSKYQYIEKIDKGVTAYHGALVSAEISELS